MSNFDPIPRLQQIAATIEESGADIFDAPATAVHYIECAIKEIERLRKERDEARRLLKAVVDMMRDNMAHDATHPHHLCDFIHRPDIGMCKVCEDWTDAMVMCYPDDFQDEEDSQ